MLVLELKHLQTLYGPFEGMVMERLEVERVEMESLKTPIPTPIHPSTTESVVEYNLWTCKQLQKELRKRALDTKGLKAVLIARLTGNDAASPSTES